MDLLNTNKSIINMKNKKGKGTLNNHQINKELSNNYFNKHNKIYLLSQRNLEENKNKNIVLNKPMNLRIKDILNKKTLLKAFSSKKIENFENISSSKLLLNKNKILEIFNNNDKSNYINDRNTNNIENLIASLNNKNKVLRRNTIQNLKNLSNFNGNKYNIKNKYLINNTMNNNYKNLNINEDYLNERNDSIKVNNINNLEINNNISNDINSDNNIYYTNNTISNYNYEINYFNKQKYKNNDNLKNKNSFNKLMTEYNSIEEPVLSINSYNYRNNINTENCKSQGILKKLHSNSNIIKDIENNNNSINSNEYYINTSNPDLNNQNNYEKGKPSILIEDNSNSFKNINFHNKTFFQKNIINNTQKNLNLKGIIDNKNFYTLNDNTRNSKSNIMKEIKTIYSKKKIKINNLNKYKHSIIKDINLLTTKNSSIFSPHIKVKNKGNYIYLNDKSNLNIKHNSLSKKLDNKINSLNININNYNTLNINNTINNNISNYNSTTSINSFNNTINTINENEIDSKIKKKKFFVKNNKSSSLSHSHNNIVILNNISMNNINNFGYDYLSKLTKKYNQNSLNNISKFQRQIFNYVSKEKKINDNENELERQKEYYNNQKKIHNKKNNQINNRINKENIFIAKFNDEPFSRKTKIEKNFNNLNINIDDNKNNFINNNNYKLKLNNKVKNINNININHIHTLSNDFNLVIDMDKINNNYINKNIHKSTNSISFNNPKSISQMIKEIKSKLNNRYNKNISIKIKSAEISPNKVIDSQFISKDISKEKTKKNVLTKFSDGDLTKIKNLKKPTIENNELKLKNKINIIKNQLLKRKKSDILNINLNIKEESKIILSNYNDNNNLKNPQYVHEYIIDIMESLLIEENYFFNRKKYIDPFYLENDNSELTPEMRTLAIDWLVLIHHKIFKFEENTLFLTIQIFDRYLSKNVIDTEKTELLLLASFILASKHNEIDYVNMKEAIQLSKNKFNKEQIIKMQYDILNVINFEILAPTMLEFFQIFANFLNLSNKKINEGFFILNIVLVDFHMLEYPNFILALAVIKLITKKINRNLMEIIINIIKEKKLKGFYEVIDIENSRYESILELSCKIRLLYNTFLKTKYKNIQEKFKEKKYDSVSNYNKYLI